MNRREFLALGSASTLLPPRHIPRLAGDAPPSPSAGGQSSRSFVLVRSGFTRHADGSTVATSSQATVVRSFDSEGRLSAFVVPVGEHPNFRGAPLHLHHEQDEWIHAVAGEFVAEVGGVRMRLKPGDSLLMPMRIPHRWSAAVSHCGAIHLYTPAGLMDLSWDDHPNEAAPQTLDQRKAWFEKYGMTLLGDPLTKAEVDAVS